MKEITGHFRSLSLKTLGFWAAIIPLSFEAGAEFSDRLVVVPVVENNEERVVLEELTVTAQKREQSLQEIPSSISALTGEDIADVNIKNISELSQRVPGLNIYTWGGRRETNVFIRGIGPGLFTPATIGFYVDGVNYTSSGMFDIDLLDIKQIEVLRGPQGTLYGGNSLGGVINVVTRQPTNELNSQLSMSSNSFNESELKGSINTPIITDRLFASVSVAHMYDRGDIENIYLDTMVDDRKDTSIRAKLRWTASEKLNATLGIDWKKFRGGSYAFAAIDNIEEYPKKRNYDFEGVDDHDATGINLKMEWGGEAMTLTSITGWRNWESKNSADQDTGTDPAFQNHSFTAEKNEQITQELRLNSINTDHSSIEWVAGIYGYNTNIVSNTSSNSVATQYYDVKNSGYAAFGQIDVDLSESITLLAGLRLDDETREADLERFASSTSAGTFDGSKSFHEWLPKVGISFQASNATLLYATISKGYRAGGIDLLFPNFDLDKIEYDSETSINYEAGLKSTMWDNRLTLSMSIFRIDLKDQQVQNIQPNYTIVTDNVGEARNQGVEIEFKAIPAAGWSIDSSLTYLDAELRDYKTHALNTTSFSIDPVDYSGNEQPYAPSLSANLSVQNRRPLANSFDLFSHISIQHRGGHYFDAANTFKQDSYQLVNAKIGIEAESWGVYLWGKNLTDEQYQVIAFDQGAGPMSELGKLRSVGVSLDAYF